LKNTKKWLLPFLFFETIQKLHFYVRFIPLKKNTNPSASILALDEGA
jgi:hypothetical protein